ncbi:PTS mannitol transporter subunit IIA [Paenibacillus pinisoli]|uniref:Mannitol-specific phosphotransferase enzyme IIA component n=1 Tax=Paenibacillus pinisoli TaxID=1276110 RepID=A0A3A6PFB4_9BACL|nr:PTS sugar transporter subunit IIA [Paenibacillus pinisoli]RJX37538.1 PTS mannitol transporter subunit IIA [Paenibacillus pinisoli]
MSILTTNTIILNATAADKFEAIRLAGQLLVDAGHVPPAYVDKMIEREEVSSTYLGGGLAMPHGTNDSKSLIQSTGISVVVLASEVDFGGEAARLVIGLAAVGDEHLDLLSSLAVLVSDEDDMERILNASSKEELLRIFEEGMES